jgi:hypothetical protein
MVRVRSRADGAPLNKSDRRQLSVYPHQGSSKLYNMLRSLGPEGRGGARCSICSAPNSYYLSISNCVGVIEKFIVGMVFFFSSLMYEF